MHRKNLRLGLCLSAGLLALVVSASGQDFGNGQDVVLPPPPVTDEQPLEVVEDAQAPVPDRISVYAGVNVVSQYVARGLAYADKVSYQPWVEIYFAAPRPDGVDWLNRWSVLLGNWNSLQSGGPGLGQRRSDGSLDNWYEADLYGGITWTTMNRLSGSLALYRYASPSDSFAAYNEVELKLNYDDAGLHGWVPLSDFGFHPAVRVTHEFDRPDEDGLYFQPSLTPSFVVTPAHELPITVAIPLVVGLGQDFYTDRAGDDVTWGFFSAGVNAAMPLNLLPHHAGSLTLTGGVDAVFPNDEISSGLSDDGELIGRIGLAWAY